MKLADRLHCPACRGRLAAETTQALRCTVCERIVPVVEGIADFTGDRDGHTDPLHEIRFWNRTDTGDFFTRLRTAAGDRWPDFLGDTIVLGCDQAAAVAAIATRAPFRSLLILDTIPERLHACRTHLMPMDSIGCAVVGDFQEVIRDAVADTVVCTGELSGVADVRTFLAMAHRVLKPGGRAGFVVPNRRYWAALCSAMAAALVHLHARASVWPEGQAVALEVLAHTRRLLVHRHDPGFASVLPGLPSFLLEKHLFDSDTLEDMCREVGFATAEAIPLDPDPEGAETTRGVCRQAGALDTFTDTFGALVASVGQPYFDPLGRQDGSASMLLWVTKPKGPSVRVFRHRPATPPIGYVGREAALGGIDPRWSLELLAEDTPGGIVVTLGGWCLCNVAVRWVRLTLHGVTGDGVTGHAAVWRPRPDVHEVLNGRGLYHPLNALCSGLEDELLFADVHATDNVCPFRLEVVLASGLVVTGETPGMLVMNEQMVVTH